MTDRAQHATSEEWALYLEGELTRSRTAEIDRHVVDCRACTDAKADAESLFEELAFVPPRLLETDLLAEVTKRIASDTPKRSRRWIWAPLAMVAAIAIVVLTQSPNEMRTKSNAIIGADDWVGVEAFVVDEGQPPRRIKNGSIARDDALAFAYRNVGESPFEYLMVFAVADDGEVFWYYPAYADPPADPPSIRAQPGALDLPDRVTHDLPVGPLHIHALFTRKPQSTQAIEKLVRSVAPGERLELADSGQHVVELMVRP